MAEAVLALEPLHEAACRVVMRLAAEDGEIGLALRVYANLYNALGEELDMEPSAATRNLVAEIKQGRFDGLPPHAEDDRAIPPSTSFVADKEMQAAPVGEAAERMAADPDNHRAAVAKPEQSSVGGTDPPSADSSGNARQPAPAPRMLTTAPSTATFGQAHASSTAWESRPSIAVLPFVEHSAQGADSLIGDGIAEEAIATLASLPDLLVTSRSSTLKYRQSPANVAAIGRELSVRYVCSGTIRRRENRLRVSMELADSESLAVVAATTFEGDAGDLFTLQDRVTERILQTVAPHIRHAELQRARGKRTENLGTYDYLLRGLDLLYRLGRDEFELARRMFEQSIVLDDHYAAPHAFIALWHSIRVNQGWSPDRAADLAHVEEFTSAALLRDPNDAHALALSGHLRALLFREFGAAQDLFGSWPAAACCSRSRPSRSAPASPVLWPGSR